jgi:hypothetical protein
MNWYKMANENIHPIIEKMTTFVYYRESQKSLANAQSNRSGFLTFDSRALQNQTPYGTV